MTEKAFGVIAEKEIQDLITKALSLATQIMAEIGKEEIVKLSKAAAHCGNTAKELRKVLNTLDEAFKNLTPEDIK